MSHLDDIDPAGRACGLRLGIAAVVVAVIVSMWAGVVISIDQSRETALKDMEASAANLAFAFDEEVTHTLDNVAGTVDAVANRMRAEAPDMNIYAWSRQFPIVAGPIAGVGIIAPNGMLVAETGAAKSRPVDLSGKAYFRMPIDWCAIGARSGPRARFRSRASSPRAFQPAAVPTRRWSGGIRSNRCGG